MKDCYCRKFLAFDSDDKDCCLGFGTVEQWRPVEDAFDRIAKEAFPNASPADKYGIGLTFHSDGTIDATLNGKTVCIHRPI